MTRHDVGEQHTSKVVAITGANRGLGRAIAVQFAQAGYHVLLSARSLERAKEAADQIEATGVAGTVSPFTCDVTCYEDVEGLVEEAFRRWGRLDVMINNAAIIEPMTLLEESDPGEWERSIRTNLLGVYNGCRAAVPKMIGAGGGVIVNISSGAAHRPMLRWSAYCTGKAGVAMLTRSIALETGDRGIRVYGFQPAVVATDMQVKIRKEYVNEVSTLPEDALLDPAIPAKVVLRLCEEAPDDLNGEDLTIRDPQLMQRLGV